MSGLSCGPNSQGCFGDYDGQYLSETLMFALRQLGRHCDQARNGPEFQRQFHHLRHYVGRPSLHYKGPEEVKDL